MNEVEIEIKELDMKKFFNKKIMLVGNTLTNEDCFADKILVYIIKKQDYLSGTIISDDYRIKDFYNNYTDDDEKIKKTFCYKRYTQLIKNRIFRENTFFILDNLILSQKNLNEIFDNLSNVHMMSIIYYPEVLPYTFDYIILTEDCDDCVLTFCYKIIEDNYPFDYEVFLEIISSFIDQEIFIVIDVIKQKMKLFELK